MITFDGVRLVWVGETGAFTLYVWQTEDEMYTAARDGCADLREADRAVSDCAAYLSTMLELMKEECA